MSIKTTSITIAEIDAADEKFIWNAFDAADLKATMILKQNWGKVLPDAIFTFTYVYEQQLKDLKKVFFKLLLKYPDMKYSY